MDMSELAIAIGISKLIHSEKCQVRDPGDNVPPCAAITADEDDNVEK
ncbi:hypothetical protein HUU62_07420 [Rhodoferax sp. 4810]|nr:hypothetical protein [Rhodoferax jenense]